MWRYWPTLPPDTDDTAECSRSMRIRADPVREQHRANDSIVRRGRPISDVDGAERRGELGFRQSTVGRSALVARMRVVGEAAALKRADADQPPPGGPVSVSWPPSRRVGYPRPARRWIYWC